MNDREPRRRSKDIKRLQRLLNAQGKIGERKRPTSSARRGMRRWWIASRDHSGGRRNFRADSGSCVSPRVQARARGHREQTPWLALPRRPLAALGQEQEPGRASREAGGRRGLGPKRNGDNVG